jgi:hypothetical protein
MVPVVSSILGGCARNPQALAAFSVHPVASYSTAFTRKSVVNLLSNRNDPEVDAAVKEYLKSLYNGSAPAAAAPEKLAMASSIEKKYVAAQIVEYGMQSISLPLTASGSVPVKRYVAQIMSVAKKAGFEDPQKEVEYKLAEVSKTSETVKEFLNQAKGLMSVDYHTALIEAVNAIESEAGTSIIFDTASPAYKKFAVKLAEIATAHKLPVKLLADLKKAGSADEDTKAKLTNEYALWSEASRVADATAEMETIKAHAVSALDIHLGKTSDVVKAEAEAAMSALLKRVEGAKGAKWASALAADMKFTAWFDASVAANPAAGPVSK